MRFILLFCLYLPFSLFAQKEDYVWCFLDSFRLDFNPVLPQIYFDVNIPRIGGWGTEANLSLSDKNGNLLFYLYPGSWHWDSTLYGRPKFIDKNGKMLENGANIKVESSSTNGAIGFPIKDNTYMCVTQFENFINDQCNYSFYYHIIEHNTTFGKCIVAEKNKLFASGCFAEKIAVVKHQNNRQWWVIIYEMQQETTNNGFRTYLVDDKEIREQKKNIIGTTYPNGDDFINMSMAEMCFSPKGDKLLAVASNNSYGFIDLFDFDRCTGTLSNWQPLGKIVPSGSIYKPAYYGCAFSPDGSKTYVTSGSKLLQFDLSS